jgi:phosphoglucomutase
VNGKLGVLVACADAAKLKDDSERLLPALFDRLLRLDDRLPARREGARPLLGKPTARHRGDPASGRRMSDHPGAPAVSPLAGKPVPRERLVDLGRLEREYYERRPDMADPSQHVSFGTSGHRGSSLRGSFNEAHILAITQAICEYRRSQGTDGPLFLGKDTHALSEPAQRTALEVLAANGVETVVEGTAPSTPTPAISRAILVHNRGRRAGLADGIVVTPSHNPPEDGGFKYNPPNGGPADTSVTRVVEDRANELLRGGNAAVRRKALAQALAAATTHERDLLRPYVDGLVEVVDMAAIRSAGVRIGVDPLGGAGLPYWDPIREAYGVDLTVVNRALDPTFSFMTVDHDGKIRMDCSSPYAMAGSWRSRTLQVAFGNDATPTATASSRRPRVS